MNKICRARPLLGTIVEVSVHSDQLYDDHLKVHEAIDAAFAVIEQIQKLMSFHDVNSELSLLNREAHLKSVQIHAWTYAVLKRAQRLFIASSGLFDCTIAQTLMQWEMLPQLSYGFESINCSFSDVVLLPNRNIFFQKKLLLDLGGIAKGFAVDLAVQLLRQHHIHSAVVNAGGDIRVLGKVAENIIVRDPQQPTDLIPVGTLENGAIATSAGYFSQKLYQNKEVTALVNPLTRNAITKQESYSVIARQAYLADALTKVVAVSGNVQHPCLAQFGAVAILIN